MSKIFKTLIFLFLILFIATTVTFATDIDMNLESPNDNVADVNETNENAIDTNNINDTADLNNIDDFEQDTISGTAAPSSVSSIAQENMSFSNILNILIITVGVILILLAIAILIRLKS